MKKINLKNSVNYIKDKYANLSMSWKLLVVFVVFVVVANTLNKTIYKDAWKYEFRSYVEDQKYKDFVKLKKVPKKDGTLTKEIKENLKSSPSSKIIGKEVDDDVKYVLTDLSDDYYIGNQRAKINVVVYSSFLCPHCINFHKSVFNKLKENYIDTNLIRYVSRVFIKDDTLIGVMLPHCAKKFNKKQNQISNLLNDLYDQVDSWTDNKKGKEILSVIAKNNGFTEDEFIRCGKDVILANRVLKKQQNDAQELSIVATPTIYVNNRKIEGNVDYETLSGIIDDELVSLK